MSTRGSEDPRRSEFRRYVRWSAGAHLAVLGLVAISPHSSTHMDASQVISVDLVSLPPAARSLTAPAPETPSAPAEKPAPPPPPPKPKEIVLPKHPEREPQKPKPEAKPKPAEPAPEKDLDELLADFRKEAGETEPQPAPAEPQQESTLAPSGVTGAGTVQVSPEVLAWMRKVKMHVKSAWVVPQGFRREALETQVAVELDASGALIGEPSITRRSGNPYYDDGVVRAIKKASPLPPPPSAGEWNFVFLPEDAF